MALKGIPTVDNTSTARYNVYRVGGTVKNKIYALKEMTITTEASSTTQEPYVDNKPGSYTGPPGQTTGTLIVNTSNSDPGGQFLIDWCYRNPAERLVFEELIEGKNLGTIQLTSSKTLAIAQTGVVTGTPFMKELGEKLGGPDQADGKTLKVGTDYYGIEEITETNGVLTGVTIGRDVTGERANYPLKAATGALTTNNSALVTIFAGRNESQLYVGRPLNPIRGNTTVVATIDGTPVRAATVQLQLDAPSGATYTDPTA